MKKERENRPNHYTLEDVTRIAKETALEHGGHQPMLIADGSKNAVIIQMMEFADTHEGRARQMFIGGFEIAQTGEVGTLEQVFLISEGWMSTAEGKKSPQMPPSKDPNRKEVLIISNLKVKEDQTEMVVLEMIRDSDENLTELLPFEPIEPHGTNAKSPLLDAFVVGFRMGLSSNLN